MKVLNNIIAKAKTAPAHIVLCEAGDERVLKAAVRVTRESLAQVTLVGNKADMLQLASQVELSLDGINLVDPNTSLLTTEFAESYFLLRQHKGISREKAAEMVLEPLCFANMMVRLDYADGSVAGAVNTTADVVRNGIQIIGLNKSCKLVSSFFMMMMCEPFHNLKGGLIFSDCALVIEPNAEELSEIASAAAHSARVLLMTEPKIAMLSFSTNSSAKHKFVDKVITAANLVKEREPQLAIDNDMQLDAAIIAEIANVKHPDSIVKGESNVLIFPNLEAGNIGYKLVQRLGGAIAIGPLLQGLEKPANDLSRGCSIDDIYYMIAVTSVQAQSRIGL
jgi:phosphate acetyltransferase